MVSRDHTLIGLSFRGRVLLFISIHGFVNPSYLQRQRSDSTIALFQFQYSTVKAGSADPSSLWSKQIGLLAYSFNITCITAEAMSKISNLRLGLMNAEVWIFSSPLHTPLVLMKPALSILWAALWLQQAFHLLEQDSKQLCVPIWLFLLLIPNELEPLPFNPAPHELSNSTSLLTLIGHSTKDDYSHPLSSGQICFLWSYSPKVWSLLTAPSVRQPSEYQLGSCN